MRLKLIKKVVVGGLITSLCLCCCFLNFNKNVSASSVNIYQEQNNWFENATFVPERFEDINDLKGKIFNFTDYVGYALTASNFSININILERDYIGIEIDENTHETIQCIDYLQYPYLVFSGFDSVYVQPVFRVFSFYQESDSKYQILFNNDVSLNVNSSFQLNGSTLSYNNSFAYLPLDNINEKYDIPFAYYDMEYVNGLSYFASAFNEDFLNEEDFLSSINSMIHGLTSFYICFPNTDRYSLTYYENNNVSHNYTTFKYLFDYIQPYNANIEDRLAAYERGYQSGLLKGEANALDNTYRFPFLTGIFNAVSDILALEIFPNVKLGYFVLVPLALGVTGMIFYFWRKD